MDKSKKREHVFSQTTSIDMSNIKEHIDCIQAFLESPYFENQLMSFVEQYKKIHHKNIELPSCDLLEATFTISLPYMCFVPQEIVALNPYMSNLLKRSNLSPRFFALEDILQCIVDFHDEGPFIVDINTLKVQLLLNLPWYFMNEFMDALGLSKYTSVKKNKKNVDVTIMPLDKMKKSFSDNLRIVKKKLEAGEPVVGQNQLGWWLVSQQITSDAERLNIKDFILEDYLTGLGSVTRGLIPESPVLAENPPEGTCNIASHEHHMKPIITKNREHLVMNLYYITEANLNPVVSESTSHPSSIIPSIRKTNFYILKKVPPFYHKVSWA